MAIPHSNVAPAHSVSQGLQAAILRLALRQRGVVIALGCLLAVYGALALVQAKYDVFPEFAPPEVGIQTEAPGLAPEQVEVLVTQPLENAINGVPGLASLRSGSIQGLSVITATFDPASDIYRDRQQVGERLAQAAAQLPAGLAAPVMTPLTSAASLVLVVGLTSRKASLMELRSTAEWLMRPRLLAIPGVSKVAVFGRDSRSIQVQIHPDALVRFGLGLNDVLAAAQRATAVRGGGFIDGQNKRIVLQTDGQSLTPSDIGRTVVSTAAGTSLTLANVATVTYAPEPPIGAATLNGTPCVVLNISEQYGANTPDVTQRLETALAALQPALTQAGISLHTVFRPATFIRTATGNVGASLLLGGALVIAVLFIFLYDLRSAAISCVVIPLSLLAAVIALKSLDITLNTMTLGGLAIAIGVVVDDAVVDLENIIRRLRENRLKPTPLSPARVILEASLEVRAAVVYATFAVLLVVFPILTLSGLAGRLFAPLGMAFALAVLASLLITLTLTPALALVLLKGPKLSVAEPPVVRWSKRHYQRLLEHTVRRPRAVIGGALGVSVLGLALLPLFQGSFIPQLKEEHFIVHMATVPGTSLTESLRIGNLVTSALRALPAVRDVAQRAGRAELADDTYGPHYSEFEVDLKPLSGRELQEVQAQIRARLAQIPGANFLVYTFLSERIDETLSGYTAPVVVNLFGSDLDVLDSKAQEIAKVLSSIPGATDVTLPAPPGVPQLTIHLRSADLERWGLDPVQVLESIRTAYQGDTVGQAYDGNRVFPIVAILDPASRERAGQVADLALRTPGGTYVRLKQVADIQPRVGRYQVLHSQAQRVQTITANVTGRSVGAVVAQLQRRLTHEVSLPQGTYIELAGEAQAQDRSRQDLLVNSGIALVGIVLLLAIVTRNARNLTLLLATLPFGLVGGVIAVFAMGGVLSLGAMVGFIALLGITLRNAILLIAHYEHLVGVEGLPWTAATALAGAADRLTPILMTSLVTGLGVLPLALGMGEPGREIEGPMALVLLGGLTTSTALNLLVLPSLALMLGRFDPQLHSDDLRHP